MHRERCQIYPAKGIGKTWGKYFMLLQSWDFFLKNLEGFNLSRGPIHCKKYTYKCGWPITFANYYWQISTLNACTHSNLFFATYHLYNDRGIRIFNSTKLSESRSIYARIQAQKGAMLPLNKFTSAWKLPSNHRDNIFVERVEFLFTICSIIYTSFIPHEI